MSETDKLREELKRMCGDKKLHEEIDEMSAEAIREFYRRLNIRRGRWN